MFKNYILKLFVLFIFFLLLKFLNIYSFFSCTVYCLPSDPDDINMTVPGGIVRTTKEIIPKIGIGLRDLGVISATLAAAGKMLPPQAKAATVAAVYTTFKIGETMHRFASIPRKPSSQSNLPKDYINIPSVAESNSDWFNTIFVNMSEVQIVATCCAILLGVCIMLFTFLLLWVIGREYADKAKSRMCNYGILNKIFLFYLKWGETTSIPLRIFFTCFIYVNINLCIYYLTYIPLFL